MFFGAVPDKLIEQILKVIDFGQWEETFVCCSGTFRIERGILQRHPDAKIFSNDVSIFSVPLGRYLMGEETPIQFHGQLEFVEELLQGAPYIDRLSALLVATDYAKHASGKPNVFKTKHSAHYRKHFAELTKKTSVKVAASMKGLTLSGFNACDWLLHAKEAMRRGAGIAAFPPFFRGDYEAMFRFVNENVAWTAPRYDLYNPEDLPLIVENIRESGSPYCVLTDQVLEGHTPCIEFVSGRKVPHFCYASTEHASFRRFYQSGTPFRYKPVDFTKLTPTTKCTIVPADHNGVAFIKDVYLQKTIIHSAGRGNFWVYLDDMLLGAIVYELGKYNGAGETEKQLYLLSDVTTSREGRLSKLVAKAALCKSVVHEMEKKFLERFDVVVTTARTKNPVSMKYRGIYDKRSMRPSDDPKDPPGTNIIQYARGPIVDTPQQVYDWWWKQYGKQSVGQARNKAGKGGPKVAQGAGTERPLHGAGPVSTAG